MNKKKIIYTSLAILITVILFWIFTPNTINNDVIVKVKKGDFEVTVTTTGELQAKSSEKILAPAGGMRRLGLWNIKITQLVPEGTKVDSGDFVASLDRSDIVSKLKEVELEIQKMQSQYTQTELDTTLTLRSARNELENLIFVAEEAKIKLEQSKYEPPATIRKAELELERNDKKRKEELINYKVKVKQSAAKMQEVAVNLSQKTDKKELMLSILDEFDITAPKKGIVIYQKNWDGAKITTGSNVGPWDPEVALLPDLSTMISKTYVNEVDIRKIKEQQKVLVTVDAFPDKKLKGKVIKVANVGEQLPNSEAKVFQVNVELFDKDSVLLPGMSTGNTIISKIVLDVLSVPLECIHVSDSVIFVYQKSGFSMIKKEVKTGISNENEIIITQGLEQNNEVLLSIPDKAKELKLERL